MTIRYNTNNIEKFTHIAVPKSLIDSEKYKDMRTASKVTYGLFLSRHKLSLLNRENFTDENGNCYIIFTRKELMECLNIHSNTTIANILKELQKNNLIIIKKHYNSRPAYTNRIFLRNIFTSQNAELINEETVNNLMHYQIPLDLIRSPLYKNLSLDAKLLYGILFDYIKLSLTNKKEYTDEFGNIFTLLATKNIAELLNCSKPKVKKLLEELKTFNLIEATYINKFTKKLKIYLNQVQGEYLKNKKNHQVKIGYLESYANKKKEKTGTGDEECNTEFFLPEKIEKDFRLKKDNICNLNPNFFEKKLEEELSTGKESVYKKMDLRMQKNGLTSNCNALEHLSTDSKVELSTEKNSVYKKMDLRMQKNGLAYAKKWTCVCKNMDTIYNNSIYNNSIYINSSSYSDKVMTPTEGINCFKKNIDYEILTRFDHDFFNDVTEKEMEDIKQDIEFNKGVLDIIIKFLEDAFYESKFIIGKNEISSEEVIELFLDADIYKIEEVIARIKDNIGQINNLENYIKTVVIDVFKNYTLYFNRNLAKIQNQK